MPKLIKQNKNVHLEINKQSKDFLYKSVLCKNKVDTLEFDLSRTTFTKVLKSNDSEREKIEV